MLNKRNIGKIVIKFFPRTKVDPKKVMDNIKSQ